MGGGRLACSVRTTTAPSPHDGEYLSRQYVNVTSVT